ncbi:MAG TPA: autotransporter-associated beta strand repeat-containing protein [bacterium]|jgi:autotransporter-associated beta strand protein|nr:autotransporter-associated beta strand repeat-containing protein [bacterium]
MNPSTPHCPVTDKKNCPAARPTWPLAGLGSKSFSPGRIFYPGLKLVVSALAASLFMLPAVQAADATWTNNAASTWATGANWDPNAAPGATSGTASADTATFYTTALTASRVVTVDTGRNIKNILFTNSTATFTLQLTGGSLLLSSGGKIELASSALANIQTFINSPITLEGGYTFLNNGGNAAPTANPLEFQGSAAISGAASIGTLTLTLGGTNGTLGAKGLLSGIIGNGTGNTLGIVKQDSGIWQLNGVNTFTGGVQIKQGAILIGNNAGLGNNTIPVILGDNATGQDAQLDLGSSITAANPIAVASGSGNRFLTYNGGSGNSTFSGAISLTNNIIIRDISGTAARTITFSGPISGTGGITFSNTGVNANNTATLSGSSINPVGAITNASTLGDVVISGPIGANITGVVENSTTSILTINSSANAYTANTTISAGTLALGATASIASSTNISVAAGAILNVSAVTGGFTLANGQTLQGAGNVNGNVTVASSSKISPAGSGVAGTLTFNNNLVMSSGTNLVLDVSTSSGSGNDLASISGTLTAGGTISLTALSGAANLDTTADYVIVTAGSISGSFASAPVWVGTTPANAANFSIVTSGSQVLLHFNTSVPPTVTASASPNGVLRGQKFTVTAVVTPGSLAPGSAISTVTIDLSFVGGSPGTSLVLSNNNVWTNSFTVANNSSLGSTVLSVTATDASALQGTFGIPFTVSLAQETWNGAGADNNWGTTANWTNVFSPLAGDYIYFAGSTRTSPNLETGYSVGGVTFNNGSASFNVGTGNGSTLTLTGGMTNNSANTQTVSAPVNLNGSGLIPINTAAGNVVLSGAVSDAGFGFIKIGSSNLTLSAANNYSGPTVISNGSLTISGSGTLGGGSSSLTNAGALDFGGTSQSVGAVSVISGSLANGTLTGTSYDLQSGTISANLAGSGVSATKSTTNTLVLTGNNAFDGGFVILNTSAGLCVNSSTAFGTGTINIANNNGGSFDCTAPTVISNANNNAILLSGNFTFVGSQSLNLGTGSANMGTFFDKNITVLSNSLEFAGSIISGGAKIFSKDGAGKLILSGVSTYFGPTAVNGGTLLVNGSLDSGGTTVTVATNGTLGGIGEIDRPVVINAGGALSPGASIGTLTVNNNLTLSGNVFIEVNKALAQSNDTVVVSGVLTNAGTGSVIVTNLNLGQPLAVGNSFQLFSQPLLNGGALTITPAPGTGLAWTNKLAVDGTIAVVTGVATNPTNITATVSSGTLTLTWPADHTGWTLQAQTNSLSTGLGTNWIAVSGSSATNQVVIPINTANESVFFRLVSP